jgi:hypothetical protein
MKKSLGFPAKVGHLSAVNGCHSISTLYIMWLSRGASSPFSPCVRTITAIQSASEWSCAATVRKLCHEYKTVLCVCISACLFIFTTSLTRNLNSGLFSCYTQIKQSEPWILWSRIACNCKYKLIVMMKVSLGVMLSRRVDRPWGLEGSVAFTCRVQDIYQTTQHHIPEDLQPWAPVRT